MKQLREVEHKLLSESRECAAIISRLTINYWNTMKKKQKKIISMKSLVQKKEQTATRSAEIKESLVSIQKTIDQLQSLKQQSIEEKDKFQNELGELLSLIAVVNEQLSQQEKEKVQFEARF